MAAVAPTFEMRTPVPIHATFDNCYRKNWSRVYRWSLRYAAGDALWAEDLAHDVFLRLLERFDAVRERDDLGGWLYITTANMAISRLRRKRSWVSRVSAAWRALQSAESPSVEFIVLRREESARALASLGALPPLERVVLTMKLLDGRSQRDIAETMGLSEGYVSKLLRRGLDRVRADGWNEPEENDHG